MLLEALKPGTLPGANGDDAYLAVVQHLAVADGKQQTSGDTTDANAQLQALAHYGVTARLVQTADFELIEEQIARGIPVLCGTIHRGPVDRPTGTGRWLIVIGYTPSYLVVNDPWGEPDLVSGATLNPNGKGLRFSRQNDRCAGLRLRQALDGGVDRRQCLPLCPGQGLGGGGGSSSLRTQRAIARFRLAHVADVDCCSRRKWLQQEKAGVWVGAELLNCLCLLEQQGRRRGVVGVADGQADNLGRKSPGHAEIEEVLVLGDQYENLLIGPFPDRGVTGAAETDQAYMGGVRESLDQQR
jgi:hypothetical protein